MNAARRARQKARKQESLVKAAPDDEVNWFANDGFPPGTFRRDVTVTAGVASASGSSTPEQKD